MSFESLPPRATAAEGDHGANSGGSAVVVTPADDGRPGERHSLDWSQGILAVVRMSAPNDPLYNWNAGVVECPQTVTSDAFHLKNFGTESITVSCPILMHHNGFSRNTNCPCSGTLAPGQVGSCSFTVTFNSTTDGTLRDTLRIQTNAWNSYGGFVRIPLAGTCVATPPETRVVIEPQDADVRLAWNPVIQSVLGCSLPDIRYRIYSAPAVNGAFTYLASTADTHYVHLDAASHSEQIYYRVTVQTP
ncbi:MAG TPA: hypothetical protein VGL38_07185 [bacterium]